MQTALHLQQRRNLDPHRQVAVVGMACYPKFGRSVRPSRNGGQRAWWLVFASNRSAAQMTNLRIPPRIMAANR